MPLRKDISSQNRVCYLLASIRKRSSPLEDWENSVLYVEPRNRADSGVALYSRGNHILFGHLARDHRLPVKGPMLRREGNAEFYQLKKNNGRYPMLT